jgi:thioredoxin-like negative regulator of GroEL
MKLSLFVYDFANVNSLIGGHCKRLAPTWEDLSKKYSKATIAKVDCTVETQLCQQQGIRGYPTLVLFKKGSKNQEKYQGARDLSAFTSWLDGQVS